MIEKESKAPVIVVGAGSGIGKVVAEGLIELGNTVIVADLDVAGWETSATSLVGLYQVDVLSEESVNKLIAKLVTQKSSLRGLVYTVGKAITLPLQSMKPSMFNELIDLNTVSFFSLVSQLLASNLFSPNSVIVVISSIVGQTGARGKIAYSASKGAIDAGIRSLACELAPEMIRINAIAPGTVRTAMLDKLISSIGEEGVEELAKDFPLGLGFPEDIANLALFLLSESAHWITGNVFTIDGGFSAR